MPFLRALRQAFRGNEISAETRDLRDEAAKYDRFRDFQTRAELAFDAANRKVVPIDTGRLQRSFKMRILRGIRSVRIRVAWRTPYAKYVEGRKPFMAAVITEGVRLISRVQAAEVRSRNRQNARPASAQRQGRSGSAQRR